MLILILILLILISTGGSTYLPAYRGAGLSFSGLLLILLLVLLFTGSTRFHF